MSTNLRSVFFRAARIVLLLSYTAYSLFLYFAEAGVSYPALLLSAVYISALASKDSFRGKFVFLLPVAGAVILIPLFLIGGNAFVPLLHVP